MKTTRRHYNPLLKSYPDSEKINGVSEKAEVLYTRLLAKSDDNNRYYGDARWVMAKLFTARMLDGSVNESDVSQRLEELETIGLIERYVVDGMTYLQLVNGFKVFRSDQKTFDHTFPESDPSRTRNADVTDTSRPRAPNPTQPIPIKDPTHPTREDEAGWQVVVDDLKKAGVVTATEAVATARDHGATLDEVRSVIRYWAENRPRWAAGALAYRVKLASGDLDHEDGWPLPDPLAVTAAASKRAGADAVAKRQQAEADAATVQREADRVKRLKPKLEAMADGELDKLAERTLDDFMLKRYREYRLTSSLVVDQLVAAIDSEPP